MDAVVDRLVPRAGSITVEQLIERAAAEVGMPLKLLPAVRRGTGLSGATITVITTTGPLGVICCPDDSGPEYQLYVIGHELWHLFRAHTCNRTKPANKHGKIHRKVTAWREQYREDRCDRFARKLGLALQEQRALTSQPAAAAMLDDVFRIRF